MQLTKSKLKKIIVEELDKILEGDVVQGNFGNRRASLDQGEYSKPADVVPGNFSQAAKDDKEKKLEELSKIFNGRIYDLMTIGFMLDNPNHEKVKDFLRFDKSREKEQKSFLQLKNILGLSDEEVYKRIQKTVNESMKPELFLPVKNFVKKLLDNPQNMK